MTFTKRCSENNRINLVNVIGFDDKVVIGLGWIKIFELLLKFKYVKP